MRITRTPDTEAELFDAMQGTRDALNVSRVFGDAYIVDDVTVIPVARVAGGGGGGSGESAESSDDDESETGHGFGTGFGVGASPLGVYEVRDGQVTWNPALDVNRIVKGAEILTAILAVCASLVVISRR